MKRRGLTIVEILVALAIFMVVGSGAMYVLSAQNRDWKISNDAATMNLTAKALLDELTRGFRMAGSGLPDYAGGMKVFGDGEERVVVVMNEDGWLDTIQGWSWDIATATLKLAVNDASRFAYLGYARVDLRVPAPGSHSGSGVSPRSFTLGVVDRTRGSGSCGDSLVLDVSTLQAAPNSWDQAGDIVPLIHGLAQNVDSISYRKSKDTLYLKRNIQPETVFATGLDSLRFWYHHPSTGWGDSLSSAFPSGMVNKVRIRLVLRTGHPDRKLLQQDSSSRGYQFCRMETDLALRNTNLTNR
ncbi:MAG: prepilin-type N-terminal cleavage/methylation domain-containing protein [Fibrobacteria bacterium]|nr:prepilin-type N-terminal cleavage/methylation domain-containing protein [Fibrobacteria bacterium]